MTENSLLTVEDLKVEFRRAPSHLFGKPTIVRAVDGVNLNLNRGETLGLVGESGCGKSTTGNALVQLIEPAAGTIRIEGVDISEFRNTASRRAYRRRGQMIFQDAYAALDPRMTIADILEEPLRIHGLGDSASRSKRIAVLLDQVGLSHTFRSRYPHEMSGGQLQRIGIARALAVEPDFIICDEPVSALDVSVQAQIINLLEDLQNDLNIALLFISHDLSVVQHIADRVAVMYLGRIFETAETNALFDAPQHPYTKALLSAVSIPDPARERARRAQRTILPGEPASPENLPSGCRFRTRCPVVESFCAETDPALKPLPPGLDRQVACLKVETEEQQSAPT